jgi:hypothetical protein
MWTIRLIHISDSSENTSKSVQILLTPNETDSHRCDVREHSFTVNNIEVRQVKGDEIVFMQ